MTRFSNVASTLLIVVVPFFVSARAQAGDFGLNKNRVVRQAELQMPNKASGVNLSPTNVEDAIKVPNDARMNITSYSKPVSDSSEKTTQLTAQLNSLNTQKIAVSNMILEVESQIKANPTRNFYLMPQLNTLKNLLDVIQAAIKDVMIALQELNDANGNVDVKDRIDQAEKQRRSIEDNLQRAHDSYKKSQPATLSGEK